ncbi:hypothetical protein ACXWTF_13155 [Thiomicrolovo sp. ZZH C-3]
MKKRLIIAAVAAAVLNVAGADEVKGNHLTLTDMKDTLWMLMKQSTANTDRIDMMETPFYDALANGEIDTPTRISLLTKYLDRLKRERGEMAASLKGEADTDRKTSIVKSIQALDAEIAKFEAALEGLRNGEGAKPSVNKAEKVAAAVVTTPAAPLDQYDRFLMDYIEAHRDLLETVK